MTLNENTTSQSDMDSFVYQRALDRIRGGPKSELWTDEERAGFVMNRKRHERINHYHVDI